MAAKHTEDDWFYAMSEDVRALNPDIFDQPPPVKDEARNEWDAELDRKRTELEIQRTVMRRCKHLAHWFPEFALIFAVPNAGRRGFKAQKQVKDEGIKAGVPDLFWPVPRSGYHGMFIEMKRHTGRLRASQKEWLENLSAQGYATGVYRDDVTLIEAMRHYLEEDGEYVDRNWEK